MKKIPSSVGAVSQDMNLTPHKVANGNIVLLWIYRILVKGEGYKSFVRQHDFLDDKLAEGLGFADYIFSDEPIVFNSTEIKRQLFKQAEKLEKNRVNSLYTDIVFKKNIESLGSLIGLTNVEIDILLFCATVQIDSLLESATNILGNLSARAVEQIFSVCLGYSELDIRHALFPDGRLAKSGLIKIDMGCNYHFSQKIEILDGLIDRLHINGNDPENIIKYIIFTSKTAKLTIDNYRQYKDEISLLTSYLNEVSVDKSRGVNILIYGYPGSGKTEFVRTIAKHCNLELFEVASESKADTPLDTKGRFRAFSLGQILCASKNRPAIMFDEVEDVFTEQYDVRGKPNNSGRKSWVNQLLESNPVPSFWITNNIESIDPAYVRRFDFVIQINSPPRSVREEILNEYLSDIPVSREWTKMMSENETLLPALIERSANVLRKSMKQDNQLETEKALETLLGSTVDAMGYNSLVFKSNQMDSNYHLDMLNTDFSVEQVCEGLKEYKSARLCLYGPPGTGKTAFGKYLAMTLDMPLLSKKASDITSPYLGVSEQNMAAMFKQAKEENAILMLDEADTFLSDRKTAQRTWEISAVNEMLTQMESFEGIFIASTNFMQNLDNASIRRFDIKLKFGYMTSEQVVQMFENLLIQNNLILDERTKYELIKLRFVTPGDFAVIRRKLKFVKDLSNESILRMIKQECEFKEVNTSNRIGF